MNNETKYSRRVRETVIAVLRGKQAHSTLPWWLLQFSDYDLVCLLSELRGARQ